MDNAGRVYVLAATIALVAMVDRVGWIDWPAIGHAALIGMEIIGMIVIILILAALVVGVPVTLLTAAIMGLLRLVPRRRTGEPQA